MHDFLVVGAGLAGISIAERILQKGLTVRVVSNSEWPSSTGVATGMFNPIVFRRLNKTYMIESVLPEMHAFYHLLEKRLDTKLISNHPIFKHISSEEYASFWNERSNTSEFNLFLDPIEANYGEVKQAGLVDCPKLRERYEKFLRSEGYLDDSTFNYDALSMDDSGVIYKGLNYDHVIFCDGPFISHNPHFNWLPFKIAKGDWIVVETEETLPERIVNNVINIIPLGQNQYKLSSTFEWETEIWRPNPDQITALVKAFQEIYPVSYKVINHQSGLRPAASDRRPYLGRHPRLRNISVFNGLGSKGVILAPFFSKHLIDHLVDDLPLMKDVDIKRHIKRFQAAH
jgi:glycine oxidase